MKRKLRWSSQLQAQSSSQERSNMAFERDAPKAARPSTLRCATPILAIREV